MQSSSPRMLVGALATVALALTSCATRTLTTQRRAEVPAPDRGATLAVVPFENLSPSRNAGLVLTDLATTLLYAGDFFAVTEVSALNDDPNVQFRRLETASWERQVGVNTAAAAAVGKSLEVDWALAGSVGEYGFVDGFGETATVGLTLRLVRVQTGEVAWTGSASRRVATKAFAEESVHRLAHKVLEDLLHRMHRDISGRTGG